MEAEVKANCIELLPGWSRLEPADIAVRYPKSSDLTRIWRAQHPLDSVNPLQVEEISGGISNLLWKLTPKLESSLGPVVARVFGEQPESMSREREEAIVLQLNKAGFCAPVSVRLAPACRSESVPADTSLLLTTTMANPWYMSMSCAAMTPQVLQIGLSVEIAVTLSLPAPCSCWPPLTMAAWRPSSTCARSHLWS